MMSKINNFLLLVVTLLAALFRGSATKSVHNPKTILVLRWKHHVGDVVYITPLFRAIKKTYPHAKVIVVGKGRVEEVIRHNPDIDTYLHYTDNFWSMVQRLHKEKIDFACLANLGNTTGLALLYLAGIPLISAFTKADGPEGSWSYGLLKKFVITKSFTSGTYAPPQYLQLLEPINANTGDAHFRLYYSPEAKAVVEKTLVDHHIDPRTNFIVGLSPGGSTPERWWPSDRFAALADYLSERYQAKILLIGAGQDATPIGEIMNRVKPTTNVVNFLNQSLDEFKATVAMTRLMIGNDSGPMVTADAFDVPNIVFVGPTDEREYHLPPGPTNRIVKSPTKNINDITFDMALPELHTILDNLKK